jgi:hypothetical protein
VNVSVSEEGQRCYEPERTGQRTLSSQVKIDRLSDGNVDHSKETLILLLELLLVEDGHGQHARVLDLDIERLVPIYREKKGKERGASVSFVRHRLLPARSAESVQGLRVFCVSRDASALPGKKSDESGRMTDLDGGGRVGLFSIDGDNSEGIGKTEHIPLSQRVGRHDWKSTRERISSSLC